MDERVMDRIRDILGVIFRDGLGNLKEYIWPPEGLPTLITIMIWVLFMLWLIKIIRLNTSDEKNYSLLQTSKNTLNIFIIVGLLGTLFAIGGAFIGLSNSLSGVSEIQKVHSIILGDFIPNMKKIFAPTAWAILVTVIGIFVYNLKLAKYYQSQKGETERFKDFFQSLDKFSGLGKDIDNFSKVLIESSNSFHNFAKDTNKYIERLGNLFGKTDKYIEKLEISTQEVKKNVEDIKDKIAEMVKGFNRFEGAMREHLKEIMEVPEKVTNYLKNSWEEFLKEIGETYKKFVSEVGENISSQINALNSSYSTLLAEVGRIPFEIENTFKNSVAEFQKNYKPVFENLSIYLNKLHSVTNVLSKMSNELSENLSNIHRELQQLGAPLQEVANNFKTECITPFEKTIHNIGNVTSGLEKAVSEKLVLSVNKLTAITEELRAFATFSSQEREKWIEAWKTINKSLEKMVNILDRRNIVQILIDLVNPKFLFRKNTKSS